MRILILGAGGQLGRELVRQYPKAVAFSHEKLDITDWRAFQCFDWSQVDVIINAAAYTNVDGAETPEGYLKAWRANVEGVSYIAPIASLYNITLVHVSSDYVFDGSLTPHREDEPFSPLNAYGRTKAEGDARVGRLHRHYILRTSWLTGDGPNFVRTMVQKALANEPVRVVNDQFGRLTFTTQLVQAIDHLLTTGAPFGTYNVSNGSYPVSWVDIARSIRSVLMLDTWKIEEISTADYSSSHPSAARRPLQSTLDLRKITATECHPISWRSGLALYLQELMSSQQSTALM